MCDALHYLLDNIKLMEFIEQTFNREGSLYLTCYSENRAFLSCGQYIYKIWLKII